MTLKRRVSLFDEDAKILELVANQYPKDSREYTALRHAAIALWYVLTEGHERFQDYVTRFDGPLTPEQRAHLIELGIEPDKNVD